MIYSNLDEAWSSPLGTQIKEFEKRRDLNFALGGEVPTNNFKLTEHDNEMNYDFVHPSIQKKPIKEKESDWQTSSTELPIIDSRKSRIIPPWGNKSEPIDKYLVKRRVDRNDKSNDSDSDSDSETNERIIEIPTNPKKYRKNFNSHKSKNKHHSNRRDKNVSCTELSSHIHHCEECRQKYMNDYDLALNENDFDNNDFTFMWKNKSEMRKILLMILSGIGVILLLDYLFKNKKN
jgi:hypothetical protein